MRNFLAFLSFTFLILFPTSNEAQGPKTWKSGEIYNALEKLNFLGSALYVAAHPDDENTRMISYLSNHVKARTGYLSLTRGDGGQNLIGPEIRELLGVIRTQELLAARRIDGGEQMFSRANDFGYSKHSDETLEIWDEKKVLGDVVWAIRNFKPDVIINRFDHTRAGQTHGHHTASAVLSYEAYDLSGDKTQFPEQLAHTQPHQARRLFYNTSWWRYGSREIFEKADKSDMLTMDIGVYYPILGVSNTEIAAESRSQHKCQGMGNTGSRGSQMEYVKILKGDMPNSEDDIFAGINTSWSRIPGGASITAMIDAIRKEFDFTSPDKIVPQLLAVKDKIESLEDHPWKTIKLKEIEDIIQASLGLYLETVTREHTSCPGENIPLSFEVTNRSSFAVMLKDIKINGTSYDSTFNQMIKSNNSLTFRDDAGLPSDTKLTAPYWLTKKGSLGMYQVDDPTNIGKPETERLLRAEYLLEVNGHEISYKKDLLYKYNSPEDGPIYRPFEITPEVSLSIPDKVQIFKKGNKKNIAVNVKANKANVTGFVSLDLPNEWSISPAKQNIQIKQKGETKTYIFEVTAPDFQLETFASVTADINGNKYNMEMIDIDYSHIPFQSVLVPTESKFVTLDIDIAGNNIAYVMGAGDDIPSSLEQIGYSVTIIDVENINADALSYFNAVIMGVRAYNKWESLKFKQKELLAYVENGGTMIIQYNTSRGIKAENLGPYPLTVSRGRVAKEEAEVRILKPEHPVMNYPNKISTKDFDGWVQERGLYFPSKWDEKYEAILSSNDPGEEPLDGGLLVAQYGDGWYVYTGYSWFRELPAGVPGAFRIFANLCALGNTLRP